MVNYAPSAPAARSSRAWLWIALAVLTLVVGLAVGRWVFPADSSTPTPGAQPPDTTTAPGSSTIGAPHGPAKITQGVPSGYTRDQAGAATAATNAIQVQVAAAHGQADPELVASTWIASNADEPTRAALSEGLNTGGDDQTNKLPATTRVIEFSDSAATVEVWVLSVGSTTGIGGDTLTATRWTTVTYQLTWEREDWKVTSITSVAGPEPGETATGSGQPALTNGLYTFFIE